MLPYVFNYDYGFLLIRGKVKKEFGDYYKENEGIDLYKTRDAFLSGSDSRKKVNKFKLLFKCIISVVKQNETKKHKI